MLDNKDKQIKKSKVNNNVGKNTATKAVVSVTSLPRDL